MMTMMSECQHTLSMSVSEQNTTRENATLKVQKEQQSEAMLTCQQLAFNVLKV